MKDNAKILLFHVASPKAEQIKSMCKKLQIQVSIVSPKLYSQTLGYLAGITGFPKNASFHTGSDFSAEMMIFSGMDSERLDGFLSTYMESALPPIGLKGIITPHNIHWTAEKLFQELSKEHQRFQAF